MRGALIVGISHYSFGVLPGCIEDAKELAATLSKDEFKKRNFDIDLLVSENEEITQKSLRKRIERLFSTNSEVALFYFSGHGTERNLGGYIVTQDAEKYNEGISVYEILQLANESQARDKIIILDCCNSGHMGNLPIIRNDLAVLSKGVSIITATNAKQNSTVTSSGSLFTLLLIQALQGGAADILGKVTIPGVYNYLDQALGFFHIRPLFKSHVESLVSLRDCKPAVDLEVLQKIIEYFHTDDYLFPLDPEFEPTFDGHDIEKVRVLSHLQCYRDARLLLPTEEIHMYDAVMKSKNCCLTSQGKYYWLLVKNGLI
ncbi:MAG: caspase family protein [Sphingobacterium sp.]|uniref:caspase family protein n=1 Tax=Sphingobacterium sp. TaxID=341027 RepID=UPI002841E076|nr:caspase family protein [Sphingobacterium sp.]MDR3007200.1 caspase family protein [Sphingobacterium sp.]